MPSQKTKSQKTAAGFTIIEVVLVLAIAGLIFLMVFVALPALQRSQRDTQRRNDMSRVDTSLVQYQTNHSNLSDNLPSVASASKWTGNTAFGETVTDGSGNESWSDGCGDNEACKFVRDYMNTGSSENDGKTNSFEDPDGTPYSMLITPNWSQSGKATTYSFNDKSSLTYDTSSNSATITGAEAFDQHVVYIVPGGRCSGDSVVASTKRHFAILYRLEGAGTYCIDDQ